MVSAVTHPNDCGVLICRGESYGKGQMDRFSPIGCRGRGRFSKKRP